MERSCAECGKIVVRGAGKHGEDEYSHLVYCLSCWNSWQNIPGSRTKANKPAAPGSSDDDSPSELELLREAQAKKPSGMNGSTPQAAEAPQQAPQQAPEMDLAPRAEEEPQKAARPRGAFSRQTQPSASPKAAAKDSGLQGRPQRKGAFSVQHKAHQLMQKIETLDQPPKEVASKVDVLAVPEEQADQTPSWQDRWALPATDAWLGLWKYGQKPTVYRIVQVDEEKLRFEGRYSPGDIAVSGVLEPQSDHLMAELTTAVGECVGSIKLRYDPERDNIVSNFKTALKTDWGSDIRAERTSDEEIAQARADQGRAEPCEASVVHSEPGPASTDTAKHADQEETSTPTVQQLSLAMKQMLQTAKADSGSGLDQQDPIAPVEVPHPTPAEHPAPAVQSEEATTPSVPEPVPASAPQQQLDGKKEEAHASSVAALADASGAHREHQPLGTQAEEPPVSTAVADRPPAEAESPPIAVAAPLPAKAEMPSTAVAAAPPAKAEMPSTAETAAPPANAEVPPTEAAAAVPPAKAEMPPAVVATAPPAKAEMPPTAVAAPLPAKAEVPPTAVAAPLPAKAEVPSTAAAAASPAKAEVPPTAAAAPPPVKAVVPPTAVAASPPAKAEVPPTAVAAPPPSKAEGPPTTVAAPPSEKAVIPHPTEAKQPHPAPLGPGEGCASAAAPSPSSSSAAAAKPGSEAAEPSAQGGQRQPEEDTVEITVKVKLRVPASSRMREVKQAFVQKLGQTKGASKIKMYQTSNESISVCADADLLDLKQDLFAEGVKIVTDKIEPAELGASPSSSAKDTGAKLAPKSPQSTAQSGMVQVVVRDSNCGDVQVDVPASATVLDVKKAVAIKLGRAGPGSVQLLISNGRGCNKCIDSDQLGSTREFIVVGGPPASS